MLRSSIQNVISTTELIRNKYTHEVEYDYSALRMTSSEDELIAKVMAAIQKNIDNQEFSVEDLGKEVGMSRVQMNRKIKETLNTTPSFLIRSTRLKQAAYLLINNKVNISEVADKVGFSTHSYFSSSFKEYFGMSPKEFVSKYMNCKDQEVLDKLFK